MAKDMFWTTVTFSIILGMLILAFWPKGKTEVVVTYDCRVLIGGWHPDFPAKVIDECRKRSSK
jgi:hypothetical protein